MYDSQIWAFSIKFDFWAFKLTFVDFFISLDIPFSSFSHMITYLIYTWLFTFILKFFDFGIYVDFLFDFDFF